MPIFTKDRQYNYGISPHVASVWRDSLTDRHESMSIVITFCLCRHILPIGLSPVTQGSWGIGNFAKAKVSRHITIDYCHMSFLSSVDSDMVIYIVINTVNYGDLSAPCGCCSRLCLSQQQSYSA